MFRHSETLLNALFYSFTGQSGEQTWFELRKRLCDHLRDFFSTNRRISLCDVTSACSLCARVVGYIVITTIEHDIYSNKI